jgi:hypothetical protein
MKRKKLPSVAILTLTLSMVTSLLVVDLASANYLPPPSIEIFSPISAPKVYNESSVLLHVRVNALPRESSRIISISYCLDGKTNVTLTDLTRTDEGYWGSTRGDIVAGTAFSVKTIMDNISEGQHSLIVYSHAADGTEMSRSVEFTVDYDYVPPNNPFGLPDNLSNGTVTLPPTTDQSEMPTPTTNTASLHPLENPLPYIIIACVSVSILAGLIFFKRKSRT